MGDGKLDAGHVSFFVYRLRQSNFGLMFGICLEYVLLMFWYVYICIWM